MTGVVLNLIVVLVLGISKSFQKTDSIKFIINQSLIDTAASVFVLTSKLNLKNNFGVAIKLGKERKWWHEIYCK
jgi:hypothetical protein